jgi:cyclopropane fatty-acyl-phospholipid synthase-like methyltransferase
MLNGFGVLAKAGITVGSRVLDVGAGDSLRFAAQNSDSARIALT